jgi:5'-3' exonuclease
MGVPQFLGKILPSVGRPIDLRYYKKGVFGTSLESSDVKTDTRRPLRIGLDVSIWIYRACQGHVKIPTGEGYLSRSERAEIQQGGPARDKELVTQVYVSECVRYVMNRLNELRKATACHLVVVLDGETPPCKQLTVQARHNKRQAYEQDRDADAGVAKDKDAADKRNNASKQGGPGWDHRLITSHLIQALREQEFDFIVAPYEADSQLAYLAKINYIDLNVTEDSDLLCCGCPVLFKLGTTKQDKSDYCPPTLGRLVRFEDLAMCTELDLTDFTPFLLTLLYITIGSDYCRKLDGIGAVITTQRIRKIFIEGDLPKMQSADGDTGISDLFNAYFHLLFENAWNKDKHKERFQVKYIKDFIAGLISYRYAVVYDPITKECVHLHDPRYVSMPHLDVYTNYPIPDLGQYYVDCVNLPRRRTKLTGALIESPVASFIAQGWIDVRTRKAHVGMANTPSEVKKWLRNQSKKRGRDEYK